jgi:hypothetical protein
MANHATEPRYRRVLLAGAAFAAALIGYLVFNALQVNNLTDARNSEKSGKQSAQATASAAVAQASKGKNLAAQLEGLCKTDSEFRASHREFCSQASSLATASIAPIPGPSGPTGPPASQGQVQAAVNAYLKANPPPIDYTILRAFVNSYLVSHPVPSGQSGSPGVSGASGQSGVNGTNGTSGTDGAKGDDAPVVTDIKATVQDPRTLVLTFIFSSGSPIETSVALPADACASAGGVWITATPVPPDGLRLECSIPPTPAAPAS